MNRGAPDPPRRDRGIRWAFLTVGLGGLLYGAGSALAGREVPVGVVAAGLASLAGLLGPTEPGGFRTNDFAAVAICFGAVALVFAYGSYRALERRP
jgi:hypothetical protein